MMASGSGLIIGIRPMQYMLQTKYKRTVTGRTIKDLMKVLYPYQLESRKTGKLSRRMYSVRGPNHMWHCGGCDKLKPFGIGIHAAIDGWSRNLVWWLRVGRTNNDPNVVCSYYSAAIRKAGLMRLILRVDVGTENCFMADIHSLLREDHDDEFAENCVFTGSPPPPPIKE